MKGLIACVVVLSWTWLLAAQTSAPPFAKVYIAKDGLVHVVDRSGKDVALAKQADQAGVDMPLLSADGNFAGWEIDQDNCCTSYPIPTRLALYSGKKILLIQDGMMVYDWCFVTGKAQVAVSTGTVHGWTGLKFRLYSARDGRMVRSWAGEDKAKQPEWARCLK